MKKHVDYGLNITDGRPKYMPKSRAKKYRWMRKILPAISLLHISFADMRAALR